MFIKHACNNEQINGVNFTSNKNDTVEISNSSNKKEESIVSTYLKKYLNFIGHLIGSIPQREQLKEKIDFKEAKTIDEAVNFGKENLGIKNYKGFTEADLDVLNWINEGLVKVSNIQKGNVAMPKKIVFEDLSNGNDAQINGYGTMSINRKTINDTKTEFERLTGKNLPYKEIRVLLEQNIKNKIININFTRYLGCFSDISHEMGHYQHNANLGALYGVLLLSSNHNINMPGECSELINLFKNSKNVPSKVSEYATTSPMEFVAECYAKMIDGIKLDDDVMQLYIKLGGVII